MPLHEWGCKITVIIINSKIQRKLQTVLSELTQTASCFLLFVIFEVQI